MIVVYSFGRDKNGFRVVARNDGRGKKVDGFRIEYGMTKG